MTRNSKATSALRHITATAILCCSVLALAGCGSKQPRETGSADPAAAQNGREDWFCQVGASNDEWDCVQDSAIAAEATPSRLPEPRDTNSAVPPPQSFAEPPPPVPQSAAEPQPQPLEPPQSTPQPEPSAVPPPPPAPTTSPAPAPESAPPPEPSPPPSRAAAASDTPPHIALSYRPSKPVAILDLPEDFFAVQLVAVSTKEALEEFARSRKLAGMSAARTWNGEQMFYILLLGIYETRKNAELAIDTLDGPLAELSNPWIRSVGSLQHAMLEADRVTGTQDY